MSWWFITFVQIPIICYLKPLILKAFIVFFSFGILGDLQLQTQKSNQSEEKPPSIISVVNNTCTAKFGFVSNQILKMSSNYVLPQKLENSIIKLHLNFLCPSCNSLLLQGRWKLLLAKLRMMSELFFKYQHAVSPLFLWQWYHDRALGTVKDQR